jgi:hypothetical protein
VRRLWPWLFVSLLGCKDEPVGSVPACDRAHCSDECMDLAGTACDVRDDGCQQRILSAVECVRGRPGSLPEIRVITEEEYRAENEEDAGLADGDAGADGGVPGADDRWSSFYGGLSLLGLYEPKPSEDATDALGGYYDSDTRSITLLNRGEPQDGESAQSMMAHELVHALQDQELGLGEYWGSAGSTTDARLARGCLSEGEAELYEELASVLLQGLSVDVDYWELSLEYRIKYGRDHVAAHESPYDLLWTMRYGVGGRFMRDVWLSGGNAAVRRLYEAPPTTTLFWMLGHEASTMPRESLTRPLACADAQPPAGYEGAWFDTLGAFALYAFLSGQLTDAGVQPSARAWELALAWRQDSLTIFKDEAGALAVSWRVRFAEEALARDVETSLMQRAMPSLRIERHADELEIRATDGPESLFESWRGTSPTDCPTDD